MVAPSTFQCQVWDKDHQLFLKSLLHPHAYHVLMREAHLMNLIEIHNIIFHLMKMIRNVKNVNVEKYCGDVTIWTYPLLPMSLLVTNLGYPPPPPPGFPIVGGHGGHPPSYNFFWKPHPPKPMPSHGVLLPLKNDAPPIGKSNPLPPIETWNTFPWNDS